MSRGPWAVTVTVTVTVTEVLEKNGAEKLLARLPRIGMRGVQDPAFQEEPCQSR